MPTTENGTCDLISRGPVGRIGGLAAIYSLPFELDGCSMDRFTSDSSRSPEMPR
jgi:hypothetical protein